MIDHEETWKLLREIANSEECNNKKGNWSYIDSRWKNYLFYFEETYIEINWIMKRNYHNLMPYYEICFHIYLDEKTPDYTIFLKDNETFYENCRNLSSEYKLDYEI